MSRHSLTARDHFLRGYNCAQSVLLAFSDVTGLSEVEALKLASPFGGGLSRLREVCGAVSASAMVLGIVYGYTSPDDKEAKASLYETVQSNALEFENAFGTYICRELLQLDVKHDIPIPEERTPEYYKKRKCSLYIETACEILDKYLEDKGYKYED